MTAQTAAEDTVQEDATAEAFLRKDELSRQASDCIKKHTMYAAVGGLVPLPLLEMVASSTIQLRMIAKLCDVYEVRFSENAVKSSISTLVATVLPATGVGLAVSSLFRSVPVVGTAFGVIAMPTLVAATTYALGKVFAWHFAKGGRTLDFKPEEMKERFKEEFEEGKRKAADLVRGDKSDKEGKEGKTASAAA